MARLRHRSLAPAIPGNSPKTLRNAEIRFQRRFYRVEICSEHRNLRTSNVREAVTRSKAPQPRESERGSESGRKGKRTYGRLARSDEHSASVAISGRESGHALQVCRRAKDSRVQVG